MKFENVKNVERLFQIIRDECSGTVELVSSDPADVDRLLRFMRDGE
ncbi:hypothetical protein [Hungatella hathewayi]